MKQLKIILPLFLISLFFLANNVKADTIYPPLPDGTKNYFYSFNAQNNIFYITYCKNDDEILMSRSNISTSGGYSFGYCYNKNTLVRSGYAYRRSFTITGYTTEAVMTNDVDLSSFTWGVERHSSDYATLVTFNGTRLQIKEDYNGSGGVYIFYSTDNLYNYVASNTALTDDKIVLNKNVFDTSIEVSCDLKELGVVKNVSSFTYEVSGIGNALKEPLKGQFAFVGRGGTPLLTNGYNISIKEKNSEEISGRYEFSCNDEDIGNGCLFKYEYNYIDDIDTPLTLQFTFTSNTGQLDYEYSFYSCNLNNSKMNYTYIDNVGGNNQIVENPSLDNIINDDNVSESDNFLNDNIINNPAFNQDHGLTAIIQAPINFLQSLNSKTCSNIVLPLPYLGNATIPCMSSIYSTKFNDIYNLLKIVINGVLCYRMALSVVMIIKGAKNPNEDKIEVMDL